MLSPENKFTGSTRNSHWRKSTIFTGMLVKMTRAKAMLVDTGTGSAVWFKKRRWRTICNGATMLMWQSGQLEGMEIKADLSSSH
ncbi:hypothetical protein ACLBR5_12095 [Escherichia coli]